MSAKSKKKSQHFYKKGHEVQKNTHPYKLVGITEMKSAPYC
jgi:hypothetical protein